MPLCSGRENNSVGQVLKVMFIESGFVTSERTGLLMC